MTQARVAALRGRSLTRPAVRLALLVVLALASCAVALRVTGATDPLVFVDDAGAFVRWAGPLVRVVHDLAASVAVAGLLFALAIVPRGGQHGDVAGRAASLARAGAVVWAVAAAAEVVLTFADAAGMSLGDGRLPAVLRGNVWNTDATRIGLIVMASAVMLAVAIPSRTAMIGPGQSRWRLVALTVLAVTAIATLGLASHTGTSADHETSVNAMAVHLVSATTWLGGLLMLVALRSRLGDSSDLVTVVRRWSAVALWSFVGLGLSGVVTATTRLKSWHDVGSEYGLLVLVKTLAFVALGLAGWWHRSRTIELLGTPARTTFWRLVAGEVAVMVATFGVASALGRSAPPVPESLPDPSATLALTGFPAPPVPGAWGWVTTWRADWLFLGLAVVAMTLYAAGLVRARRAGHVWPRGRAVAWSAACLFFAIVTSGAIGTYGRVSISWHVAGLVAAMAVVGPLLACGQPVRLALLTIRPRRDGSTGVRELLVAAVRSRSLGAVLRPTAAVALTCFALVLLVLGGGLEWSLRTHPGHVLVTLAMPLLGALTVAALGRAGSSASSASSALPASPPSLRSSALAAVALAVFCTLLGLALVLGSQVLAAEFFVPLALVSPAELLVDQHRAGLVIWAAGTVMALTHLAVIRRRGAAHGA